MIQLPDIIRKATESMTKLQGIGEKSAFRMVMNISKWNKIEIEHFAKQLSALKNLNFCSQCGFYAEENLCDICSNQSRVETRKLCIVETIVDMIAIERSGQYPGIYHILGGVLNPLLGVGPKELKLDWLKSRIETLEIEEVLLAVNPSIEGDATCAYLKEIFPQSVRMERIGFGVPIGGSLEYLDSLTIGKALENRKILL